MKESSKNVKDTKVLKDLEKQSMLNNQLMTILARNEALNIVVSIVNALLSNGDYSKEQIGAIQATINAENDKTQKISDELFNSLHKAVDAKYESEKIASDIAEKEKIEEDDSCVIY